MKYSSIVSILLTALTSLVVQTSSGYENDGLVQAPPEIPPTIDDVNFVNSGQFIINFTNDPIGQLFYAPTLGPVFETQNTINYTNFFGAVLACNSGFRFADFDSASGLLRPAASFVNYGAVHAGTIETLNNLIFFGDAYDTTGKTNFGLFTIAGARCLIEATNIINHGEIDLGFDSLLKIDGGSIDLKHSITREDTTGFGFGTNNFIFAFNNSIFDGYWGIGDPVTQRPVFYPGGINPNGFFASGTPQTPIHPVTTRQSTTLLQTLGGPTFNSYIDDTLDLAASNRFVRIVFLSNTNTELQANVFFPPFGDIDIEYSNTVHQSDVNLYVEDNFGILTNFQLLPNSLAGYHLVTFQPFDYSIFESPSLSFGPPAVSTAIPPGTFFPGNVTNQWQAYEALFNPLSYIAADIYGRDITNGPGRVEINASSVLDLTDSEIASQNYLLLRATNHFISPEGTAQISSPTIDLNLRSTNGLLSISNIIAPQVTRYEGKIDLWSARWTNVVAGITNRYHVLFADTQLSPTAPERSDDVYLRVTNFVGASDSIVINDLITVSRNLLLDAERITIATNDSSALSTAGGVNITDNRIVWPNSVPRLRFFTNNGSFMASNAVFFGGLKNSPYDLPGTTKPYQVFINSGSVSNFSSQIQANLFNNSGIFNSSGGAITLLSQTAVLTNGAFISQSNNVLITASDLQVSNHIIQAGGRIDLQISGILDDGSLNPVGIDSADFVTNKNIWTTGNGLNLLSVPFGSASLLATTITNTALPVQNNISRSAARDLGCSTAGFNKNAAVGRLVLNGGDHSLFTFSPVTGNNALYIDDLELMGYTTNFIGSNFFGIKINPGMKIYFANASANGVIIADKLDGANGGRFCWVKDYNCGPFSSVNLVYEDGSTNRVNVALAQDCNLDSDGDHTVNCLDPSPIPPTGNPCTPAPFQPVVLPTPAITAGTPGAGSGQTGGSDGSGNPKIGVPPTTGSTNGPATFIKGIYSGLFSDVSNGVATADSGYFTATASTAGAFTAKINLGGHTYVASGLFSHDGQATVKFHRGTLKTITATLQLDDSGNQITGELTDGNWISQLLADRLVFTKKGSTAADFTGSYTLRIPAQPDSPNSPAGDGFATVTIDAGGIVKLNGSLADGSKIAQRTAISELGFWPLYTSLYRGGGSLMGWLQVTNLGNITGQLVWTKLANVESKTYPGGFTNDAPATGSVYRKPAKGGKVFNWSHGQMILSGGGLATWTNEITLDKNKASVPEDKLQLNLVSPSGLFRGHIRNPDTGKMLQIQGAVFQDLDLGYGYFLNSGLSGQVILTP